MVRQKTISLDEKTAIIAGRMHNFSQWVRLKLIEHARFAEDPLGGAVSTHIAPESARIWGPNKTQCNPRHKKGVCSNCYPDGVDA
jgi:hypothetical protein